MQVRHGRAHDNMGVQVPVLQPIGGFLHETRTRSAGGPSYAGGPLSALVT